MKKMYLAIFMTAAVLLSSCTAQVRVPVARYHSRTCSRVWVPGHFNARGFWIGGHWNAGCF